MRIHTAALALFIACAGPAPAHDYKIGDLEIEHPHVSATTANSLSAAGYFGVTNTGSAPDRLLGFAAEGATLTLHLSQVDDNGVATMKMLPDGIDLPPGETVILAPGALHVMFTGMTAPLVAGQMEYATLIFEKAGRIVVEFKVEAGGAAAHDHRAAGATGSE